MRITTNMIHSQGLGAIDTNNTKLYKAMQQATTGKRVNSPSDDPVASALALGVQQSKTKNLEFNNNQKSADSSLKLVESQLAAIGDALHSVRVRLLQAGDGAYSDSDIDTLVYDIREALGGLVGLANSTDAMGNYLFTGYQSSLMPFVSTNDVVTYYGDQGQRLLQVGENRYVPTTYNGHDLFMNVSTGNGYFTAIDNTNNRGSGVIYPNGVYNVQHWEQSNKNFTIRFAIDHSNLEPDGPVIKYDIIDNVTGNSVLTGVPSVGTPDDPANYWRTYTPGDTISFNSQGAEPDFDYGFSVQVKGEPTAYLVDGVWHFDEFTIEEAVPQSIFQSLTDVLKGLERQKNSASEPTPWDDDPSLNGNTGYTNVITQALLNIDHALDNVLRIRTEIGTHLNELDALMNTALDTDLIYEEKISGYLDVDYATAISDYARYKVYLQAAQQTFAQMNKLSLFNYI